MLATTLVAVSRVFVAGVVVVVNSDVVVALWGSGHKRGGWRLCWGAIGWPGSKCRRFRGAVSCFGAGDGVVVAVVDNVGNIDGSCAGIVSDDVAASKGVPGCVVRVW